MAFNRYAGVLDNIYLSIYYVFMFNCFHFANLQFYFDMKFVILFASQGRYLSRNLNRAVNEIINKALAAFSATGVDPNRLVQNCYELSNIFKILKL